MKYISGILIISFLLSFVKAMNFAEYKSEANNYSVYIIKYRWHTGIVINKNEANQFSPLLKKDFTTNQFVEIGWGDKDYYMAKDETIWLALKAILIPTESVIHVHGFNEEPEWYYRDIELIKMSLTEHEYQNLIKSIYSSFATDSENSSIVEGQGLVNNSYFYLSNEKYHLFKTCNVWTAQKLKKGGIKISPFFAITSESVIRQLKNKNKQD